MNRKHYDHLSPFAGPVDGCIIDGTHQRGLGTLTLQDGLWRFQTNTCTLRSDGWVDMMAQVIRYCADHDVVIDYV